MSDIVQQLDLFTGTLPKLNLEGKTIKLLVDEEQDVEEMDAAVVTSDDLPW